MNTQRRGCLTVLQTWHGAGLGYCPAAWILHLPTRGAGVPRSGNGARAHERKEQSVRSKRRSGTQIQQHARPWPNPGAGE